MGIKLLAWAAVFFLLALPTQSRADTIYTNLDGGTTYNCCGGWGVGNFGDIYDIAMPFTVPVGPAYSLTQIEIALSLFGGGTNSALVRLLNDSGGLPGGSIDSWGLGPLPGFGFPGLVSTIQSSQTISGIAGITLSGGTQYWLAAFPGDPSTQATWNLNTTGASGPFAVSTNDGSTWRSDNSTLGAFAVYGNPVSGVPEPSTMLLLGTGLAGLFVCRRRAARS